MKHKVFNVGLDELHVVVDGLKDLMKDHRLFLFEGPLGAGKTTLIRLLLERCDVVEAVTSPTFTYLHVYTNAQGGVFYHFDLYRVDSVDDFLQAGFDEYLHDPKAWVFVEWPSVIEPLIKDKACRVVIDYTPEGKRKIDVQY